jgi:hypothetical protein
MVQGRTHLVVCAIAAMCALFFTALTGCTVYPDQKQPSLMQTTSAEQVDRIFWQDVQQSKWVQANALLAPNAVWRVNGQVIPRAEIVPWLQSLGVHGVQVSDMSVTPAVNDMNLVYTVQIQAEKIVSVQVDRSCAGKPQTLTALAVWQQPQPTGNDAKDKQARSKAYAGYLLTVHDLTTAVAEMEAQTPRPHGGCS